MKHLCQVYRSPKNEGMYLYVNKDDGLSKVPESLLARFGKPQSAMLLLVTPDKKLARVNAERLLACLDDPGYYLQLPPAPDGSDIDAQRVREQNTRLGG
ncbi:YcgL domain-containing protein [Marinimicrobium alkaliphilum]|uniref:YcgL domain-containing protein n=1 Tax=Marinimicrobium alkaliphilum TaxID=2202654 RepID=UPI000DB92B08|nr:YcgL domain-containing protein [Marinimicrobium alkaliphilum]